MTQPTAAKLFLIGCRVHGIALGVTLLLGLMLAHDYGCTSVKGPDTSHRAEQSTVRDVATTQRTEAFKAERYATTRSAGGESREAEWRADVVVSNAGVHVTAVDHASATTQPNTVTVNNDRSAVKATSDQRTDARTAIAVKEDVTKGPSYSGSNADVTVDGDQLTSKAIRSKLADRWVIVLVLAIVGTLYLILPPPKGSTITAIGFYAAAAASLVLSDFWFLAICGGSIVLALWPHLRTSKLYTRLVAQAEDWKSDMPPGSAEREAFDATLALAGRGYEKYVDKVRVQAKHAGVAKPVPAVPEVKA